MPVFRAGPNQAPEWSELEQFEIVQLKPGELHIFPRVGHREKLLVAKGRCRVAYDWHEVDAPAGTNLDLDSPYGQFKVLVVFEDTTLVWLAGRWGIETGGAGLFAGAAVETPTNSGDPVTYQRNTAFDNHYHDCDEYWIIVEGRGIAVSEGKHYELGPGDCLATGMGHHHDLAWVVEPIQGVYFETTLEGQKRRGHLWNHTHGRSCPKEDRV
ncbi:MAG: cupin domain-containing protein [Candidatus Zipacnadales bacterium]